MGGGWAFFASWGDLFASLSGLLWALPVLVLSSGVLARPDGKRSRVWMFVRVGQGREFLWGMGWFAGRRPLDGMEGS